MHFAPPPERSSGASVSRSSRLPRLRRGVPLRMRPHSPGRRRPGVRCLAPHRSTVVLHHHRAAHSAFPGIKPKNRPEFLLQESSACNAFQMFLAAVGAAQLRLHGSSRSDVLKIPTASVRRFQGNADLLQLSAKRMISSPIITDPPLLWSKKSELFPLVISLVSPGRKTAALAALPGSR